MRSNIKNTFPEKTHEGASSPQLKPISALKRSVMACMLFEKQFYESGEDIAQRIKQLVKACSFEDVAEIAIDAREKMKLRHAPLMLVRELLRSYSGRKVGDLITRVVQRPDELGELLALYWSENKSAPIPAQLKIGLARGLKKFNEYQLAKWNKDGAVKLRDVLFLSHAKPDNEAQAELFKKLAENKLETPDTWEVALSGGADKKETFERLLTENKLGALALLRNLRGMVEAGVSDDLIIQGIKTMKTERVLPFRFISAARYAPRFEQYLEEAMFRCLEEQPKLKGKTAILVDHSGSMQHTKVSAKSELDRFDAACGLAMLLRETAEHVRVFAFSNDCVEVAPRRGFALADAIKRSMSFSGTVLGLSVHKLYSIFPDCERLIVITDEQSSDRPPHPRGKGYIINVASYKNGIGYGPWTTIDGWSEAVIDYIQEFENQEQ